jgi:hypothetical protein
MSDKSNKPKLKKEEKKREEKNTISLEDELSDEEFHDKFLKESAKDSKSPKPMAEDPGNNEVPDIDTRQDTITENDIKTEL